MARRLTGRAAGRRRITVQLNDAVVMRGEILALDPPRRLVLAWREFEDGALLTSHAIAPDDSSRLSFTLREVGDATLLTLRHERIPAGDVMNGFSAGWHAFLDALVASIQGAAPVDVGERFEALQAAYHAQLANDSGLDRSEADYEKTLHIAAPPESVFRALVEADALARWWDAWSRISGSGHAGGKLEFFDSKGDEAITMRVRTADPGTAVIWDVLACPVERDWEGTSPAFFLSANDSGTNVRFVHRGLRPQLECYEMCRMGWDEYLPQLPPFVESTAW